MITLKSCSARTGFPFNLPCCSICTKLCSYQQDAREIYFLFFWTWETKVLFRIACRNFFGFKVRDTLKTNLTYSKWGWTNLTGVVVWSSIKKKKEDIFFQVKQKRFLYWSSLFFLSRLFSVFIITSAGVHAIQNTARHPPSVGTPTLGLGRFELQLLRTMRFLLSRLSVQSDVREMNCLKNLRPSLSWEVKENRLCKSRPHHVC